MINDQTIFIRKYKDINQWDSETTSMHNNINHNIKFPFYIWQRLVNKNKGKKQTIIIIIWRQSSVGQDCIHYRSSVSSMTAAT